MNFLEQNIIRKQTREALKNLVKAPGLSGEKMNAVSNEIKFVEKTLKNFEFIGADFVSIQINGHDNNLWLLQYDIKNKRICCRLESDSKSLPLLEHKFGVREYMVEYLPDLINALKEFK